MKDLWYFEQRTMGGGWSPCTMENIPQVRSTNGVNRLRGSDGAAGPRIRRLVVVPEQYRQLPLGELHNMMQAAYPDV